MKKLLLLLVAISLISMKLFSQQNVTGTIKDTEGKVLPNVTISVKGTEFKTFSTEKGEYLITIPQGSKTLTFQLSGYLVQEVNVDTDVVNVVMSKEIDIFELTLEELMNLEVVTASKSAQTVSDAPATVVVVTEEQITARGYTSLLDVLTDLPDFKTEITAGLSPVGVRGIFHMQYFQILLDGMRISSPSNEELPIFENFPVNLAKQIEIVYGPASALYGADAVACVINIITKTSEKKLTVDASSSYGSFGTTNSTLFISKRFNHNTFLTCSGQYFYSETPELSKLYKNDTLVDLSGLQSGTFNTSWGSVTPARKIDNSYSPAPLTAYNAYANLKASDFSFTIFKNFSQFCSSWGYTPQNAVYNKDAVWNESITSASAIYSKDFNRLSIQTTLTGSRYDLLPESNYQNIFVSLEKGFKYAFSNSIKAEQQVNYKISEKLNFVAGAVFESFTSMPKTADLDAQMNEARNIGGVMIGTRAYYNPDGIKDEINLLKYSNSGTYLQARYAPAKIISFTLGARYDYSTNYGETFNPRLGIVVNPTKSTTIKALYGSAFLAPRPFDAYEHYGSFYTLDSGKTYQSGYWHLPNPELEPIYEKTFELSAKQFIGKNFSITINGYYIMLSNLYAYIADADYKNFYDGKYLGYNVDFIDVLYNQGTENNYGGSVQLNHSAQLGNGRLNTNASFCYVDGTIEVQYGDKKTTDAQLPYISPYIARLGADYICKKFTLSFQSMYFSEQRVGGFVQADIPNIRQTLDGYFLLNIYASYSILEQLTVFASVKNATNTYYRTINGANPEEVNPVYFRGYAGYPLRIFGGLKFKL